MEDIERRKLALMIDGAWCPACDQAIDDTWGCACHRERVRARKAGELAAWHHAKATDLADQHGTADTTREARRIAASRRLVQRATAGGLTMSDRQAGIPATQPSAEIRRNDERIDLETGATEWTQPRFRSPKDDRVPFRG